MTKDKCVYQLIKRDGYGDDWRTSCGEDVYYEGPTNVGLSFTPLPNEYGKFCPYCGKEIEVEIVKSKPSAGGVMFQGFEIAVGKKRVDERLAIKKDESVPKVGDIVRLNDTGIRQIFGSTLGKSHMKTLEMMVTQVDDESMTYPEPTFCLQVDDPEINQFLIDHHCFDIVKRA